MAANCALSIHRSLCSHQRMFRQPLLTKFESFHREQMRRVAVRGSLVERKVCLVEEGGAVQEPGHQDLHVYCQTDGTKFHGISHARCWQVSGAGSAEVRDPVQCHGPFVLLQAQGGEKNNDVVDQYQSKMETALDQLAKYVADNTNNEDGATSATTSGVSRGKERLPNKFLAPAVLMKDDTPEKMRNWVTDFTTFLQSGDALAVATQQEYFRCLIDHHLRRAMELHIMPNTPVLGKGGCLEILRTEFQVLYLIFARQVDFFKVSPKRFE